MARVDFEDDSIRRWVIFHYRFDPDRRQRRYVAVTAFDNKREYQREFKRYAAAIHSEIASGERDSRETVSGVEFEPGHASAAARGHNVRRAIEHGANPSRILKSGPLPHNMAVFSASPERRESESD